MQKVKVTRYISGRRPEYAPSDSDSEEGEDEEEEDEGIVEGVEGDSFADWGGREERFEREEVPVDDRRLQRLRERQLSGSGGR